MERPAHLVEGMARAVVLFSRRNKDFFLLAFFFFSLPPSVKWLYMIKILLIELLNLSSKIKLTGIQNGSSYFASPHKMSFRIEANNILILFSKINFLKACCSWESSA